MLFFLSFQFLAWKPPSWVYETEVIMGKSIFSVSQSVLSKYIFITATYLSPLCDTTKDNFPVHLDENIWKYMLIQW